MVQCLQALRYSFFGFYIAFNAIICSVTVWHLSLVGVTTQNLPIDIYVIVVAALAIAYAFFVIFIELAMSAPITSQLWHECTWIALLMALRLSTAVAESVIGVSVMCSESVMDQVNDSCTANRVLLAFLWISTILDLGYLSMLLVLAAQHHGKVPNLWHTLMRDFRWSSHDHSLTSGPTSPVGGEEPKPISPLVFAPQPRQAARRYHTGLTDYEVEHFQLPPPPNENTTRDNEPRLAERTFPPIQTKVFYPEHARPSIEAQLPTSKRSSTKTRRTSAFVVVNSTTPPPSPPPNPPPPSIKPNSPTFTFTTTNTDSRSKRRSYIRPLPVSPPPPTTEKHLSDTMARSNPKGKQKANDEGGERAIAPPLPLPPTPTMRVPPPPRSKPSGPRRQSNPGSI